MFLPICRPCLRDAGRLARAALHASMRSHTTRPSPTILCPLAKVSSPRFLAFRAGTEFQKLVSKAAHLLSISSRRASPRRCCAHLSRATTDKPETATSPAISTQLCGWTEPIWTRLHLPHGTARGTSDEYRGREPVRRRRSHAAGLQGRSQRVAAPECRMFIFLAPFPSS
jgi:hypothetical protein